MTYFRPDLYRQTRFSRNLDEALRSPKWSTAIHGPYLPAWKRLILSLWRLS